MGSSRLPGKMLKDLAGKPVIARVFDRARECAALSDVWLATTDQSTDDVLASWAKEQGIACFRGSENDVLDRYYQTALAAKADVIVRITGDCPITDARVIDQVVQAFDPSQHDYVSNTHPPTYPDGLDTEVCSFATLKRAWEDASLTSEREHVMPYIWNHPERFRLFNVTQTPDLSAHRWTLDTQEDLDFLRLVVQEIEARGGSYRMEDILTIIDAHPEWKQINAMYERNEGYTKSLQNDKT